MGALRRLAAGELARVARDKAVNSTAGRRSRLRTSLGCGCNTFSDTSSNCLFQCLNSCVNPGQVTTVDNDVHAIEVRVRVCIMPEFISLSDAAKGEQSPL